MKQHGLTAEVSVQLHYQLATRKGEERVLPPARDWISSVAIPRLSGEFPNSSCSSPPGFMCLCVSGDAYDVVLAS